MKNPSTYVERFASTIERGERIRVRGIKGTVVTDPEVRELAGMCLVYLGLDDGAGDGEGSLVVLRSTDVVDVRR